MNTLKNSVNLIGRLGNDPEIRNFDSGKMLASFSLATNESYTNHKGEKVEDTQWHNVVAWGKTAELVEKFLKKGTELSLQGKLVNRSYESEGVKRYLTEVQLAEFYAFPK